MGCVGVGWVGWVGVKPSPSVIVVCQADVFSFVLRQGIGLVRCQKCRAGHTRRVRGNANSSVDLCLYC